jgi:DNA processing protein
MTADEHRAYLTLALTPGIGWVRLGALRSRFGTWSGALAAPFALLRSTPAISAAAAAAVTRATTDVADRAEEATRALGGVVLVPSDTRYPGVLLHLPDPPPVLFARGRLDLLDPPAVAVVGSRRPTRYGQDMARAVAGGAAAAGLVVVSGMARGLDAVAHHAALDAGAGSIGVLGNGLGVVYPAANRGLYRRMAAEGLLLTEYPPGERPNAGSFPGRNRLIAGLARVTVVVEAALDSGALNTAGRALDQGREVMAVPGPVTSPTSAGTNALIRDGAGPWLESDDLLAHYPEVPADRRAALRAGAGAAVVAARLRADLRRVFDLLGSEPRVADDLARRLDRSPAEVLALLSELELDGVVEARDGGFVRAPVLM